MILIWQANTENVSIHPCLKIKSFSVHNLRQVKSFYCKNLQSNLNLEGLEHTFCVSRSGNQQFNHFAGVQTISVLSALIMALTSSCWGSSLHPGDSAEAQPCGLTSSEVWVVPVSQPPLNPAPGGARAWLWTCAPGVVDPTGCVLLLALISVSLTILALLAAGTQDLFHC